MFAELDETIRRLLIREVPLDPSEVDVSFEAPDRDWSGRLSRPTVNCFLYDVRENLQLRVTDYDVRRQNGTAVKAKAPRRIDATYQVSAWARAPEDEHQLLWRSLAALARYPLLPEDILQGALQDQPYAIPAQVAQPDQSPRNAADLWQVIDNRIRPSLSYVLTLALDTAVQITSPLIFTRVYRVDERHAPPASGRGGTAEGETREGIAIGGTVHRRGATAEVIPDAVIVLRETGETVTADGAGRYRLSRAPRGPITLVIRAPGRREVTRRAEVPASSYDVEV